MSGLRTRIAPTPSGYLHAGNAMNFLLTDQLAREEGGSVLLRIDDLDVERARPAYIQDVFDSLRWLGITWDEGPRDLADFELNWSQRLRLEPAHAMLLALRDEGHLYACTCSRKQVSACTCRDRNIGFNTAGAAWRLRVPDPCTVRITNWPNGTHHVDLHSVMRDPVLRQRNGSPAYQLVSLAEDRHFVINLVVRGEDLLPSSACQVHIAGILGLETFCNTRFLHHPLLFDAHGHKLSKSEGATSLRALRIAGETAEGLRSQASAMLDRLRDQGL